MISIESCKICKNSVHSRLEIAKKAPFFAKNIKNVCLSPCINLTMVATDSKLHIKIVQPCSHRLGIKRRKTSFHGKNPTTVNVGLWETCIFLYKANWETWKTMSNSPVAKKVPLVLTFLGLPVKREQICGQGFLSSRICSRRKKCK